MAITRYGTHVAMRVHTPAIQCQRGELGLLLKQGYLRTLPIKVRDRGQALQPDSVAGADEATFTAAMGIC